jgi:hypothetical protein
MNKPWVLFHLRQGRDELTRTIAKIEADPEYDYGEFSAAMAHLYHHLNTAWNSRDVSDEVTAAQTDEQFYQWRSFPTDMYLGE